MTTMKNNLDEISKAYPCREDELKQLYKHIGHLNEILPNALIIFGDYGTGKTTITKHLCTHLKLSSNTKPNNDRFECVYINLIQCYTMKIFYESILNQLHNHRPSSVNNYMPHTNCDNLLTFISELKKCSLLAASIVLVFDSAERFVQMNSTNNNVLSVLMRLRELTGLNITSIFISIIPIDELFQLQINCNYLIFKLYFRQYTKKQMNTILQIQYQLMFDNLQDKCNKLKVHPNEIQRLQLITENVYRNYIDLCLNVFFRNCRNLNEIQSICMDNFLTYALPILNGTIESTNITKLYQQFSIALKAILTTMFTRTESASGKTLSMQSLKENNGLATTTSTVTMSNVQLNKHLDVLLELPFYTKYLLIAAFLASHNPITLDRRLFMKNHGKQRKRKQTVNANAVVSEKHLTQLGPKSFSIDRLLAIFYAILDEKVGLTCNLLAQISSLVHLKFLQYVSGENNIMDSSSKLQCTIGLEFVTQIGRAVGFNVRKYLHDFI